MSIEEQVNNFWISPEAALFGRPVIAKVLCHSVAWLELLAHKGGGPRFYKSGRLVRYKKSDVLRWIDENTQLVSFSKEYIKKPLRTPDPT